MPIDELILLPVSDPRWFDKGVQPCERSNKHFTFVHVQLAYSLVEQM
jgi:hypothetical protein